MTLVGPAGSATGSLKQRASQVAGAIALAIAAAALAGWWAGLPLLSNWGAGLPAMMPPGALCLAALGLGLLRPGRNQQLAAAVGALVALLVAFLLGAVVFNVDGGVQQLALRTPPPTLGPDGPVFRMAHTSTLAFLLTGAAFALSRYERHRFIATALAGLAAAIMVFALLSYLSGIDTLYGAATIVTPPLPTIVGLLSAAAGILLRIGAMPALRTPRPLWRLLSVLGCAIIVPLLLFGAYAEVSIADAHLNEARRGLLLEARALSAEVDREILGEIERLQALAASPSLRQGDFAAFQRQAEASLALRHSGDIVLVDRDMRELADTGTPYGLSMEKAEVPDAVARALATGKPQFTDLFTVSKTKQVMFGIIVPVTIDGENRYALMRSLSQHTLAEPIAADRLPPGWQAVISGASHRILARSDDVVDQGFPGMQRHGAARSGVLEFTDAKGQPALEAYADSALTGWETAVWEPKALLEAPIRALWRTLAWLALTSLGLVVGLALWVGRIISTSVGHVANHAMGFVAGDVAVAAGTPVAEVNALMAQLREAAMRRQAAEDQLRASERQLRLVTDTVPVAIMRCDADGRCMFANKLFMERRGLIGENIIGRHLSEVLGDRDFAAVERYVAACLAGNAVEFEFAPQDGAAPCVQARFAPEWRDGEVIGLIGATTDITRLKQAERRLRASEVTFRKLVDDSPFGVYVVDADLRIVQASAGACATFATAQPLIGRDLDDVLKSTWREPFASEAIERFRHTLATGQPHHAPGSTQQRKDTGAVEAHDWKIERLTMPDGRPGVVCHFYDLSERQKYEAALRESEAIFRAMFDSSAVGKTEVDVETGRFLRVNAAMCQFVGYSEQELLGGMTVFDITHPDDRARDREAMRRLAFGAIAIFDEEKRYVRKDGATLWTRVTANTIRDESGRAVRAIAVVQDLNERKRAEQDLEASRTRLQLALDAARLGWFQYDPARQSGCGDARFREIYDVSTVETPLDKLLERVHPDDLERAQASLAATLNPADPQPALIDFRIKRRDGEIRWVEIHGLASFEGEGNDRRPVSLIGTVQDITERKRHEEQTQLLMREVNHRAKNMLSVVDAIAHQTATKNPEDFISRFSERIQALSANQDLLVRNEWNGVVIADLVRAQLAHFSDLIGSRIMVRGPSLRLKAASAQAIGLALHELATNAGKYGALSTETGCVNIRWHSEGDMFNMSWTECNGPPVTPPKRRGFGTIVMEMMAERTVNGKVDLDYAPSGVNWRLTCPAANALELIERKPAARIPA